MKSIFLPFPPLLPLLSFPPFLSVRLNLHPHAHQSRALPLIYTSSPSLFLQISYCFPPSFSSFLLISPSLTPPSPLSHLPFFLGMYSASGDLSVDPVRSTFLSHLFQEMVVTKCRIHDTEALWLLSSSRGYSDRTMASRC